MKADRLILSAFILSVGRPSDAACCDVSFKIRKVFVEFAQKAVLAAFFANIGLAI